jgi:hypothetical protein
MEVMRRSGRRRLPSIQEWTHAECQALVRALFRRSSTASCFVAMLGLLFGQNFRTCAVVKLGVCIYGNFCRWAGTRWLHEGEEYQV